MGILNALAAPPIYVAKKIGTTVFALSTLASAPLILSGLNLPGAFLYNWATWLPGLGNLVASFERSALITAGVSGFLRLGGAKLIAKGLKKFPRMTLGALGVAGATAAGAYFLDSKPAPAPAASSSQWHIPDISALWDSAKPYVTTQTPPPSPPGKAPAGTNTQETFGETAQKLRRDGGVIAADGIERAKKAWDTFSTWASSPDSDAKPTPPGSTQRRAPTRVPQQQ